MFIHHNCSCKVGVCKNSFINFEGCFKQNIEFFVLAIALFIKSVLFHFMSLGYDVVDKSEILVHQVYEWLLFIIPKVAISMIFASPCFLLKKRWGLILNILMDVWLVCNLLYFKVNDLFIDVDAIRMVGNLTDVNVTKSIFPYLYAILPFVLITIACWYIINKNHNAPIKFNFRKFAKAILTAIVLMLIVDANDWRCNYLAPKGERENNNDVFASKGGKCGWKYFVPFNWVRIYAGGNVFNDINKWERKYITDASIFHYLPAIFIFDGLLPDDSEVQINYSEVEPFLTNENSVPPEPTNNLIVILVESLESWMINGSGQLNSITPNLNRFCTNEHVLFSNKITSQAKHGISGDGQMIINTGLLPTNHGAACMLYGRNVFPNFAHLFNQSAIINPWPNIWNQDVVTYQYGYKTLVEPTSDKERWNDSIVLARTKDILLQDPKTAKCLLAITLSTHMPFNADERLKHVHTFDETMPKLVASYLDCLSYTDYCIGQFLTEIENNESIANSTIIITGDHTVFKSGMRDLLPKISGVDKNLVQECSYCPIWIYSPKIRKNTQIHNIHYQMDIYPTILDLLDAQGYYWKGFGISLLKCDVHKRTTTEQDASCLSDKIIRTNFFKNFK